MDKTLRLYPYYSTIFCPFFKNEKVPKNGQKVNVISLLFLPFFAPFSKMKNVAKNGQKVKAIALLSVIFS